MDEIGLTVDLACIVGILPWERVDPQPLRIELAMELDLLRCGESGDLSASVNYGAVDDQVRWLASQGRFLLIESLALAIARAVLLPPPSGETRATVERVTVTIRKPTVLRASEPRVTLARGAEVLRGELLIDVPEVRISRVTGAEPPATASRQTLSVGPSSWLVLDRCA